MNSELEQALRRHEESVARYEQIQAIVRRGWIYMTIIFVLLFVVIIAPPPTNLIALFVQWFVLMLHVHGALKIRRIVNSH